MSQDQKQEFKRVLDALLAYEPKELKDCNRSALEAASGQKYVEDFFGQAIRTFYNQERSFFLWRLSVQKALDITDDTFLKVLRIIDYKVSGLDPKERYRIHVEKLQELTR